MHVNRQYADLIEAMSEPGCAVCRLLLRDGARYIDSLLYEYVNEVETHQAFRAGRGLCNIHGHQMQQVKGAVLGIAILHRAALDEVLKTNFHTRDRSSTLGSLLGRNATSSPSDKLEPTVPCLVCEYAAQAEKRYVSTIAEYIAEPDLQASLAASGGLCLPHFRQSLERISTTEGAEVFTAIQRKIWEDLRAELDLFITKYDAKYQSEPMGKEGDSWRRAIRSLVGEAGVFGLRRR
jgi:hypothetical protein